VALKLVKSCTGYCGNYCTTQVRASEIKTKKAEVRVVDYRATSSEEVVIKAQPRDTQPPQVHAAAVVDHVTFRPLGLSL
jgi:hypothetical protein